MSAVSATTRQRHQLARPILATTTILTVLLTAWLASSVDFSTGPAAEVWGFPGSSAVWALGFVSAGFLADRARPDIPVGILMMLAGFSSALQELINQVMLGAADRLSFGIGILGQLSLWTWMIPLSFLITALLRFPDGVRLGSGWLRVEIGLWVAVFFSALVFTLAPAPDSLEVVNPLAVPAWSVALEGGMTLANVLWQLVSIVAIWSIVVRLRRSTGTIRLQLKWVAFSGAAVAVLVLMVEVVLSAVNEGLYRQGTILVAVSVLLVPIAMAMAMLRYRLYDVDRVVSRSVAYSLVAAVLGLVYAGVVVALQTISPASGNLAVAASTLAVAVLFNPVRLRMQRWVDRRFNRASYDAAKEVDAFTNRLSSAVDPGAITLDLGAVLAATIQPSSALVWIRGEPRV